MGREKEYMTMNWGGDGDRRGATRGVRGGRKSRWGYVPKDGKLFKGEKNRFSLLDIAETTFGEKERGNANTSSSDSRGFTPREEKEKKRIVLK